MQAEATVERKNAPNAPAVQGQAQKPAGRLLFARLLQRNVEPLEKPVEAKKEAREGAFVARKKQAYIFACSPADDFSSAIFQRKKLFAAIGAGLAAYVVLGGSFMEALQNIALASGPLAMLWAGTVLAVSGNRWMGSRVLSEALVKRGFGLARGRFESAVDELASKADGETATFIGIYAHGNDGFVAIGKKVYEYPELFALLDRISGKKIVHMVTCKSGKAIEALGQHAKKDDYLIITSDNGEKRGTNWLAEDGGGRIWSFLQKGSKNFAELAEGWRDGGLNAPAIAGSSNIQI